MQRDILGKNELNSVKLNWNYAVPGLMTTRCCATGTCENYPIPRCNIPGNFHVIYFLSDNSNVQSVTKRYGYLRT